MRLCVNFVHVINQWTELLPIIEPPGPSLLLIVILNYKPHFISFPLLLWAFSFNSENILCAFCFTQQNCDVLIKDFYIGLANYEVWVKVVYSSNRVKRIRVFNYFENCFVNVDTVTWEIQRLSTSVEAKSFFLESSDWVHFVSCFIFLVLLFNLLIATFILNFSWSLNIRTLIVSALSVDLIFVLESFFRNLRSFLFRSLWNSTLLLKSIWI